MTTKITYHVATVRSNEIRLSDLDFFTEDPKKALDHLKYLKNRYPGIYIEITKKTETIFEDKITEKELEKMVK